MPAICAGCGEHLGEVPAHTPEIGAVLCRRCSAGLQFLGGDGCRLCQAPATDVVCNVCASRRKREGSSLDGCRAGVAFEGNAEGWIRDFKYPGDGISGLLPGPESIVVALARDISGTLAEDRPDLVLPVPLHPKRLRARGFNPAATLARAIANCAGARLSTDLLIRKRDTPSQTQLGRRQRRANVSDAFACTRASVASIWLVDDVVTTGATLEEAARCLRRAGAKHIQAVCAARTL